MNEAIEKWDDHLGKLDNEDETKEVQLVAVKHKLYMDNHTIWIYKETFWMN